MLEEKEFIVFLGANKLLLLYFEGERGGGAEESVLFKNTLLLRVNIR